VVHQNCTVTEAIRGGAALPAGVIGSGVQAANRRAWSGKFEGDATGARSSELKFLRITPECYGRLPCSLTDATAEAASCIQSSGAPPPQQLDASFGASRP